MSDMVIYLPEEEGVVSAACEVASFLGGSGRDETTEEEKQRKDKKRAKETSGKDYNVGDAPIIKKRKRKKRKRERNGKKERTVVEE